MISKQEASELIFAGVLGCLDRADQTKLNEYVNSGGELPSQLGEYQNIAALLPIVLNPEIPAPQVKDRIARKLYRIKDEIRAKIVSNVPNAAETFYKNSRRDKRSNSIEEIPGSDEIDNPVIGEKRKITEPVEPVIDEERKESEQIVENKITPPSEIQENIKEVRKEEIVANDFEPVSPVRNTFESFKSTREKVLEGNFAGDTDEKKSMPVEEIKPEPKIPTREKIKTYERVITKEKTSPKIRTVESPYYRKVTTKDRDKNFDKAYKKKFSTAEGYVGKKPIFNFWVLTSIFVILLLMIIVLYLNFASELKDVKLTNEYLKQQVNDLNVKFRNTHEIQSLLESSDVKVVNLDGTGINPEGSGKLIISFSQNKGYLQLTGMPVLGQDRTYQLWMQMPSGEYFSLGLFNPSGRVEYFPVNMPQPEIGKVKDFFVTEEPAAGASRPGNNLFLRGSLQ